MYYHITQLLILWLMLDWKSQPSKADYTQISPGYTYSKDMDDILNVNMGWLWDNRTYWIEFFYDHNINLSSPVHGFANQMPPPLGYGLRASYPFSAKINSMYIGGGGGAMLFPTDSTSYGFFTESTAGYSRSIFQRSYKIETYARALIFDKVYADFGVRFVMGFTIHKPSER